MHIMTDLSTGLQSYARYSVLKKTIVRQKLIRSPNISLSTKSSWGGRARVDRCGDAFVKDHSKGGQFCALEWNVHARSFLRFFRFYVSLYICVRMRVRKHNCQDNSVIAINILLSCFFQNWLVSIVGKYYEMLFRPVNHF